MRGPETWRCRPALAVAVVAGLVLALLARINDPTAKPIRWGLLWLAIGFVLGPCLVFGAFYLLFKVAG